MGRLLSYSSSLFLQPRMSQAFFLLRGGTKTSGVDPFEIACTLGASIANVYDAKLGQFAEGMCGQNQGTASDSEDHLEQVTEEGPG